MNIRKYIPNTITCLNLVSGCIASVMAFEGNLLFALLWIVAAAVFDFFDGLAARALKAYSPMGKELDSLADVVSFGVLHCEFGHRLLLQDVCLNIFLILPLWFLHFLD